MPAKPSSTTEPSSATDPRPRTTPPVWVWAAIVGLAALAAFHRSDDPDYWFHLAAGRSISQHGLPSQETWSQGAHGQSPWLSEWLFDVALYQIHRVGGDLGVALWRAAWAAAAMALAIRLAFLLDAATWALALLVPLLLAVTREGFEPRPEQLFIAFVLFAAVRFEEARRGRDRTRWLVPAQILWANIHRGWAFGPLIAWVYAATAWIDQRRARRRSQAAAGDAASPEAPGHIGAIEAPERHAVPPVSVRSPSRVATWAGLGLVLWAASAVVPRPLESLARPLAFLRASFDPLGFLPELRPWSWAADRAEPFTALLALWLLALLAGGRRMWKASPALTLIALAGMALGTTQFRFRGLAAWTSFVVLAVAFAPRGRWLLRGALLVPPVAACLAGFYWLVTLPLPLGAHPRLESMPVGAAALAESLGLEGRMLNTAHQGGYLLWARGDETPPLIDRRGHVTPELRSLYARSLSDQFALDSLLDQSDFDYLILQPPQSTEDRMAVNISRRLEWGLIFYDDSGLLYLRWNRYPAIASSRAYRYFTPDYIGMLTLSEQARADSGLRVRLEAELLRARAASPAHSRASMWLGLMALSRRDGPAAVRYFDETYRIAPDMPGLALRQGMAHEMIGDAKGAIAAYRRALREEEDRDLARHSIRQLQQP